MFCLRSWIPILFFLTNASPVYLILFISATYFLNRPCVYCSLLLAILVISLFDFHTPWFESAYTAETTPSVIKGPNSLHDTTKQSVSAVASIVNATVGTVSKAAADALKRRAQVSTPVGGGSSLDWAKGAFWRKEWRINCLDVIIRL